ncbi:unnamed protein product, partial [Prorocentrum cordatum]
DGPESREPPAGWWGRLLGGRGRQPSPGPGARAAAVAEAERSLDLAGGLDAASARAPRPRCGLWHPPTARALRSLGAHVAPPLAAACGVAAPAAAPRGRGLRPAAARRFVRA